MPITAAGSPAICTNASPARDGIAEHRANANQTFAPDGSDLDDAAILHHVRDRATDFGPESRFR